LSLSPFCRHFIAVSAGDVTARGADVRLPLMNPTLDRAQSRGARAVWVGLVRPLAGELIDRSDELSEVMVQRVLEGLPGIASGLEGSESLRAALAAGSRNLATMLERGDDPDSVELPLATLALVRDSAQRGTPLLPLVRVYRLAFAELWADLLAQLTRRASSREELGLAAALSSDWLLRYLDRAQAIVESAYAADRERWLRSSSASRTDAIDAILAGRRADEALASQRLRHNLALHHVGVVAWSDHPGDEDARSRLEVALEELTERSGADALLIHPLGLAAVSGWMSRVQPFAAGRLDTLGLPPDSGVRAAVGAPRHGITGFRRSHAQALEARRVATLARRPPGSVTRYSSVALTALATVDLDQAREFVTSTLGSLAGDDDTARRLAATLRVYLEENGSRARAAERLSIHENTVGNRVQQAAALAGRPVDDDLLELQLALALAPLVR
jgi:PucR C-terminal helix-turn-helix domain/GGDEF-like domain